MNHNVERVLDRELGLNRGIDWRAIVEAEQELAERLNVPAMEIDEAELAHATEIAGPETSPELEQEPELDYPTQQSVQELDFVTTNPLWMNRTSTRTLIRIETSMATTNGTTPDIKQGMASQAMPHFIAQTRTTSCNRCPATEPKRANPYSQTTPQLPIQSHPISLPKPDLLPS